MKITETKKATIEVTNEEYRTIQTFCKLLNDNLCFDDVSCAVQVFGEKELLFFDGVSPTGNNIDIEIKIKDWQIKYNMIW